MAHVEPWPAASLAPAPEGGATEAGAGAPTLELKLALPARRATALAVWLDSRCERDPHYPEGHVRSLYLDTPGLRFLREKIDGDYLKAKIRLRWYAADAQAPGSGPVWLEIKRRESLRRFKTRVRYDAATSAGMDRDDPGNMDVAAAIHLIRESGLEAPESLRPTLALAYSRSRWIEPLSGTRVALDQAIQPTWVAAPGRPPSAALELQTAILEFKGRAPAPPRALARLGRFGCRATSFSKYFRCYARLVPGTEPDAEGDLDAGILG